MAVVAEEVVVVVVVVKAVQRADLLIPSCNKKLSADCGADLGGNKKKNKKNKIKSFEWSKCASWSE